MKNNKQNSIMWFIDQIYEHGILDGAEQYCHNTLRKLYDQAEKIHKEECIDFYVKGCKDTYGMDEGTEVFDKKDAEKYYNETFNIK